MIAQPILEIDDLSISFFTRAGEIPAVMNFSASVQPGQALGLVGESGCGKSTVALGVMRDLGVNGRIVGGSIRFKGRELTTMSDADLRRIRGSEIAMIYQEPMASLNPAMKVGRQLMEVPLIHEGASAADARAQALRVVEARAPPRPCADPRQLPPPALGRPAAAHRHRHGADVQARAPDPRRTDHRARRDRRGRHRRSGPRPRPRVRHLDAVHQPQSRPRARHLRPDLRHVLGRGGGNRADRRGLRPDAPPLHPGAVRSIPLPGASKTARPLVAIPGNFPCPTNARRAATSVRGAATSRRAAATPATSRWRW